MLDTNTRLVHRITQITAFNIATALARTITTDTGDIEPGPDTLTLDPRATAALTELCAHLTATTTYYPGTDLTLHYRVKTGT